MLLKSIFRNLKKERFYAALNISSLALGIFCFLVVALFVRDEYTHDKWHTNSENIYIGKIKWGFGTGTSFYSYPPLPYAEAIKENSPGVIESVNISFARGVKVKLGNEWFEELHHYYSTPALFKIFDFDLEIGDPETALVEPKSMVISKAVAGKYFGDANPLGEFLEVKDKGLMKITGVLEKIPPNSHLQFDLISSIDYNSEEFSKLKNNWNFGSGIPYLLLKPGYSLEQLKADTEAVIKLNSEINEQESYEFSAFGDAYMNNATMRSTGDNLFGASQKYIYIFSIVGSLILFVACFNYVNLTSARLLNKTKDVLIRKIVGASRRQLVINFILESLFYSLMALIVALISLEFFLPGINEIIGKQLDMDYLNDPSVLLIPMLVTLFVGLLSGIYPALVSSKVNLSSAMKGQSQKFGARTFRKSLIVLQFMICGGLIIASLIIRGQANYLIDFDMGYDNKNVINLHLFAEGFTGNYTTLKSEIEKIPGVEDISASPMPESNAIFSMSIDSEGEKKTFTPSYLAVDKGFRPYFGIELLEGESFEAMSEEVLKKAVLLNETAVKSLDISDPIGFELTPNYIVSGVVQDFHFSNAKSKVRPLMIRYDPDQAKFAHIKFRPENKDAVLAQIETVWSTFNKVMPFEFDLIEGHFEDSYQREESLMAVFNVLSVLIIVIALFGLFALADLEAKQREKEVGVRKILGASYVHLVKILGNRFLTLVFLALLLAIPASYFMLDNWLNSFPYRMELSGSYFALTTLSVVLITTAVLTIHGYSIALRNPVDVIKND